MNQEEKKNEEIEKPLWQNDDEATKCPICTVSFTFLNRKHHCRYCGKIFCSKCTNQESPIPWFGYDSPVRICTTCWPLFLKKQEEVKRKNNEEAAHKKTLLGVQFFKKKDYRSAEIEFSTAIQLAPHLASKHYDRGSLYALSGENEKALLDLNNSLRLDPNFLDALKCRSNIFWKTKQFDKAKIDYSKIIELDPKYWKAFRRRGEIFANERNYLSCINDLNVYLQEYTTSIEVFQMRAVSLIKEKRNKEALNDFNTILRFKPGHPIALKGKCNVYFELQEWENLINDVSLLLEDKKEKKNKFNSPVISKNINTSHQIKLTNEEKSKLLRQRAQAYITLQDFRNALEDLELLLHIDPTNKYANSWIENIRGNIN
eukprot:TRINITY_DN3340_c0_g1_i1.p1 TRINITY_DN3340_c0_g1~~TRINITY_DN3340_c0_g1_i1.p1  ORF type:complete len:373 (+),score=81.72 TRINITY_DN3340_c0_g1_i1:18-1136(+)